MRATQLLSIEITTECNLAGQHARCPNSSPLRYRYLDTKRRLDDGTIVNLVRRMYKEFGFCGMVAWHYYNEPLMAQDRILALMERIRDEVPESRFLLWTNGTLLPDDLEPLKAFDRIVITDYGSVDSAKVEALSRQQDGVSCHHWPLDARLQTECQETPAPCARMFTEFIVDAFGNVHLCCFDWQGRASVGNIYNCDLAVLVRRWRDVRDSTAGQRMKATAPAVCRACPHKSPNVAAILPPAIAAPNAVESAKHYVHALRGITHSVPPDKRKVAVVFVSYLKVPTKRLKDHFRWNGDIYRKYSAKVYVVAEKHRKLPKYARTVVYQVENLPVVDGKPRFNLCATKNAGIDKALEDGADVVLVIDVDHAFSESCFASMVSVADAAAVIPVYRMVDQQRAKETSHIDTGATGAIAMVADNWRQIRWEDRCIGYGADDGVMLNDIRRAGLTINRDCEIEHVEHPGAKHEPNEPGHGRDGCYGRDDFNADNFEHNRQFNRR
jgi:hypothetical protein